MKNAHTILVAQINKAKETLNVLETDLYDVRLNLKHKPEDAGYLKDLKRVLLEMTITLNEIEHCQTLLDQCKIDQVNATEN